MGMLKALGARRKRTVFDEEALPHVDALYNYARHLTHNERDAEDLVQDTLVKAFRFFHRYEPGTNCKAWLFRIMTNTFLKKNRRNVREFSYIENVDVEGNQDGLTVGERSATYRDPERELLSHIVNSQVTDALADLPADFRTVVLLADLQDFTYKEIAEVMDCPVGTVMSRLYRARQALQKKLLDFAMDEGYVQAPPQPRRRGRGARRPEEGAPPEQDEDVGVDADASDGSEGPTSLAAWRASRDRRQSS
jgi:RNA polymerase sigma-70 factor (ECF subfamily)